jgi:hypothetical protein
VPTLLFSIIGHYETKQDGILNCRKANTVTGNWGSKHCALVTARPSEVVIPMAIT